MRTYLGSLLLICSWAIGLSILGGSAVAQSASISGGSPNVAYNASVTISSTVSAAPGDSLYNNYIWYRRPDGVTGIMMDTYTDYYFQNSRSVSGTLSLQMSGQWLFYAYGYTGDAPGSQTVIQSTALSVMVAQPPLPPAASVVPSTSTATFGATITITETVRAAGGDSLYSNFAWYQRPDGTSDMLWGTYIDYYYQNSRTASDTLVVNQTGQWKFYAYGYTGDAPRSQQVISTGPVTVDVGPPPVPSITSPASVTYAQNQPVSYQITASSPVSISYDADNLPLGVILDRTTGRMSGRISSAGTRNSTIKAINSSGTTSMSLTWTINAADIHNYGSIDLGTVQQGQVVHFTRQGTTNFPAGWTELKVWPPNNLPAIDLGDAPIGTVTSYIPNSGPGTYTFQYRVADVYYNFPNDQSVYLQVDPQRHAIPYTTNFEPSEGYTMGNLYPQFGWLVQRGAASALTGIGLSGTAGVDVFGGSQRAEIKQSFSDNQTQVFVDLYAKPVGSGTADTSSYFDFGSSRVGFVVQGTQAAVMVFNGDGNGAGTWQDSGSRIPINGQGQTTQWVRVTVRHDYTTHTWDLIVDGVRAASTKHMLSDNPVSFSDLTFYGNTSQDEFLDQLAITASNPFPPPTIPASLSATGKTDQSFILNWASSTSSTPVVAYEVSLNGGSLGTVNSASMTITGLAPLTSYAMRVRALNSAGFWSDWSPASGIATLADTVPPTPPDTVSYGGVTGSSVNLSWSGATDDVGVSKYIVYRDGVQIAVLNAGQQSYTDTGLAFNTTYNYTIVAYDAANNFSDPSLTRTVTTQNMPVPVITSAASIKAVSGVAFSYAITATNSPTSYAVLGTLPVGLSLSSSSGVISGTPTQLGNYSFSISASNAGGAGASTLGIDVIPPLPIVQLLSPAATTVHVGDTITVTGQATDPIGGGLLQHYIEIQRPAGGWSAESWLLGEPWGPALMGGHVLKFAGQATTDSTMFIDSVSVRAMPGGTPAPIETVLENPSFEFPKVGTNDYNAFLYSPTTGDWSFINTGVAGNNSGFTSANPNAPAGTQVGFIQLQGTLSQTIYLEAGSYQINAQIAKRWWGDQQSAIVTVDGLNAATFSPTALTYTSASTGSFTVGSNYRTQSTKSSPFTFNLPGTYRFRTRASNAAGWSYSGEVVVTVLPSQSPNNHNPLANVDNVSATGNILSVQGWAIDYEDGMVSRVEVLIDDNLFATINQFLARQTVPDVAIDALNYPSPRSRYVRSQWKLNKSVGALRAGNHTVRFIAYDSQGGATSFGSRPFSSSGGGSGGPTAPSTPTGRCESAVLNNGTLTCAGWAIDKEDGAPIASVAAFINGVSYGNVSLGSTRLDIANYVLTSDGGAYPGPASRYNNCGWSFSTGVSGLSSGTYSVTFIASDSQGNKGMFISPSFTINAGPLVDSDHDGIPDSVESILGTNPSGQTSPTPNDPNLTLNVQTPR